MDGNKKTYFYDKIIKIKIFERSIKSMNSSIIPKNGYRDCKEKHNNQEEWKNFARRICKNPYAKNYHKTKSRNLCSWCNMKFIRFSLHHIDYDHLCVTSSTIKLPTPTEKRPNKTIKIPDCESCHKTNPKAFNECMKRVTPVHLGCNYIISTKS
ncbi:hypothetical protein [Bacillus thuringiensis]|uniref:hypothetical protein n=2 Tax=Bacillus thuringiensis TaxID=1428 RepID=UPI000BF92D74|nr:hypothetical protein [Bacillus thuringiensis]PFV54530.1 hypothetical protein COL14_00020 [Bacillus thuringiensis]PGW72162.1 hypothetical protein COE21_24860 [Bacillus thuringiensis]